LRISDWFDNIEENIMKKRGGKFYKLNQMVVSRNQQGNGIGSTCLKQGLQKVDQ
jgi:hypothetical protein